MFPHIISDPSILGGKPCIKGTRISVDFLLELVADGASVHDIIHAYPHLTLRDVGEALQFARHFLKNDVFLTVTVPA